MTPTAKMEPHDVGSKGGPARSSIRRRSGAISITSHASSRQISTPSHHESGINTHPELADAVNEPPSVTLVHEHYQSLYAPSRMGSCYEGNSQKCSNVYNPADQGLILRLPGPESRTCDVTTPSASEEYARNTTPFVVTRTTHCTVPVEGKYPPSTRNFLPNSSSSIPPRPTLSDLPSLGRNSSTFGYLKTDTKLTTKFPISRNVKKLAVQRSVDESGSGIEHVDCWTAHKWWLFLSTFTLFCYGTAALVYAILTWFKTWEQAEVMYIADYDILVLITLASTTLLLTFVIGITGTILNSRPILAVYALLLWPGLISLLAIGYAAYKRHAFSLDRKLNLAWSQWYTPAGRLAIQNALRCCGYSSPLHEATASPRCYVRSALPGCKGKLWRFEKVNLQQVWTATFSIVPLHIFNIFVSLLCSNHVTKTFGKGIMPRRYRLNGADVQADADKILGALRQTGAVVQPTLTHVSGSATFREDKVDSRRILDRVPASLRPGYTPGLPLQGFSRKLE